MYHETTRKMLIRTYRIPEDYHAIDAAILLGEWNPAPGMEETALAAACEASH